MEIMKGLIHEFICKYSGTNDKISNTINTNRSLYVCVKRH
jgi:hypothetical protein